MATNPKIAKLREHVGEQVTIGNAWPAVSLGTPEIDRSLPKNGLETGALYEIIPETYADYPATLGFGLGVLSRIMRNREGYVLWVQPTYRAFAETALYPIGLCDFGIDPNRFIHVKVPKSQNVLWALDEALANTAVVAAIGLFPEDDRAYDFTASRRLAMRATSHGATAFVFHREPGFAMASASAMRWSVATQSSFPLYYKGLSVPGVGTPRWHIRVAKSRSGNTGHWFVEWDHETLSFRMASRLADRAPVRISGIKARQRTAA